METKPIWKLEWNENLSMFLPEIDAEHQRFILLINQLNETIAARKDIGDIKKCMRAIMDDAAAHFAHEEALFREWRYPSAEEHAKWHAQITQALSSIMDGLERGMSEYECIEAGLKIKQVLIQHLLTEDMKYRDFFLASDAIPKGERF